MYFQSYNQPKPVIYWFAWVARVKRSFPLCSLSKKPVQGKSRLVGVSFRLPLTHTDREIICSSYHRLRYLFLFVVKYG